MTHFDTAIIGGGPAGTASALFLREMGFSVCLLEKKIFPRETLCGEFFSTEVTECLSDLGMLDQFKRQCPNELNAIRIHTERGQTIGADLGFTAYGMKRGSFDHFLLTEARNRGVTVIQPAEVTAVVRTGHDRTVRYEDGSGNRELSASVVIAAYGRQNILDKRLHRDFTDRQTHLNGIKFHINRSECPGLDARAIHLFTGSQMYCGVNAVNDGKVTVCFLERRMAGDESPRRRMLRFASENSLFRKLFSDAFEPICETVPLLGTGNIYFGTKEAVIDGIYTVGDAAGVIAPLTGDGIGMAFEGARLLAHILYRKQHGGLNERAAELSYARMWHSTFRRRLRTARSIQSALLSGSFRAFGMDVLSSFPRILPLLVRLTRG